MEPRHSGTRSPRPLGYVPQMRPQRGRSQPPAPNTMPPHLGVVFGAPGLPPPQPPGAAFLMEEPVRDRLLSNFTNMADAVHQMQQVMTRCMLNPTQPSVPYHMRVKQINDDFAALPAALHKLVFKQESKLIEYFEKYNKAYTLASSCLALSCV